MVGRSFRTAATWSRRTFMADLKLRTSNTEMLWSSFATARLKASIGFHESAFEAKLRMTFATGVDARASNRMMERSVAQEANTDVSTGFQATAVIVSADVGHL